MPPLEEVRKYLDYAPATGCFTTAVTSGPRRLGDKCGYFDKDGYLVLTINYSKFFAHRIAWLLVHKVDPGDLGIDHKDGDPANNRIDNLRLATQLQNLANCPKAKGITYSKRDKKWIARLMHSGTNYGLGYFDCPLLARLAYEEKKRELCGEFSPV